MKDKKNNPSLSSLKSVLVLVVAFGLFCPAFAFAGDRGPGGKAKTVVVRERTKLQFPLRLPWRKEKFVTEECAQAPAPMPMPTAVQRPVAKSSRSHMHSSASTTTTAPAPTKSTTPARTTANNAGCRDTCKPEACKCPPPVAVAVVPPPAPVPAPVVETTVYYPPMMVGVVVQ